MKLQTITLSCVRVGNTSHMGHDFKENERVEVKIEAYVKKGLAVHKCLHKSTLWTITHIASSVAFTSFKMNKQQAIQWLEESAELPIDWTLEDPLTAENAKQFVQVPHIAMRIRGEK